MSSGDQIQVFMPARQTCNLLNYLSGSSLKMCPNTFGGLTALSLLLISALENTLLSLDLPTPLLSQRLCSSVSPIAGTISFGKSTPTSKREWPTPSLCD